MEEHITISKKEYEDLIDSKKMLKALRSAGVDNWQGYDFAHQLYLKSLISAKKK